MPFGVDLPENFDAPTNAPESTEVKDPQGVEIGNAKETLGEAAKPETLQELLDLDKHERFRWQGKEWSQKDLLNSYLMREDYTRKTQELSEARKYAENFDADLARVVADPNLIAEFKKIYPRNYVRMAEQVINRITPRSEASTNGTQPTNGAQDVRKVVKELLGEELAPMREATREAEVQRIEGWLDSVYDKLGKKYPSANADLINTRALAAHDAGHKITEEVLEKLFKQAHDEDETRYMARSKKQVEEQKKANAKAKDIGSGGSAPSGSPRKENFKDAKKRLFEDIEASA